MRPQGGAGNDIVAGEHCPLCGGAGVTVAHKEGIPLRLCRCVPDGSVLLAWAYPSERDYERLYEEPGAYHVQAQASEGQSASYERDAEHLTAAYARIQELHRRLGPLPAGCLLADIGSGLGGFVQAAQEAGYQAWGLEPSPDAREWANARHRTTHAGAWADLTLGWDLVTLHDVFEHLTRPQACLAHLRQCLNAGGRVVIEMPEWGSEHQRQHGWEWRHIRPRQHVCLYSRLCAEALFERAGFQVEAFWRPCGGGVGKASWVLQSDGCERG